MRRWHKRGEYWKWTNIIVYSVQFCFIETFNQTLRFSYR